MELYICAVLWTKDFKCIRFRQHMQVSGAPRGGVLPEKFGRGVRPASQNPYPIYDQAFDTLFMTWLLDH